MILVKRIKWAGTLAWLSALALFGCLPELSAEAKEAMRFKPHQNEAMQIVWVQTYGMSMEDAPPVKWMDGAALDCPWDQGVSFKWGETCAFGRTDPTHIEVAWNGSWVGKAEQVFPHELCHYRQYLLTGDDDAGHQGLCFKGENLATTGQVALMDAGLW